MIRKRVPLLFLCTVFIALISSCSQEEQKDYSGLIVGNWFLERAERNGEQTNSLDNTFFEFKENGLMVSNFNLQGEAEEKKFTLRNNLIIQAGSSLRFRIDRAEPDQLVLKTIFNNVIFRLILRRKTTSEPN